MTHLNIQQSSNVEIVGASLIQKLYETALATPDTTLAGNLLCEHCKYAAYEYLMGNVEGTTRRFPNLNINVTNGIYIDFADPDVADLLAYYVGDGTGVTFEHARSFNAAFGALWRNVNDGNDTRTFAQVYGLKTSVNSFDEFLYFTGTTSIAGSAFKDFNNLSTITLPSTVTSIGSNSFLNCSSLQSINVDDITSVGQSAFSGCTSLTSLAFDNLTTVGVAAFSECSNLLTIQGINTTSISLSEFSNCTALKWFPDQGTAVYNSSTDCIEITSPITQIARQGFYNCTSFPGTCTTLYNDQDITKDIHLMLPYCNSILLGAFKSSGVKRISMPLLTDVYHESFLNCTSLTYLDVPSATTFGTDALNGCTNLSTVTASQSYTVGLNGFRNCSSLLSPPNGGTGMTSVGKWGFFHSGITSVDLTSCSSFKMSAFGECYYLTSVTLNSNLTELAAALFYRCRALPSITLPSNLEVIGDSCFYECRALTTIDIPSTITSIGTEAFIFSGLTTTIIRAATPPTMGERAFFTDTTNYVYVPDASVEAYKTVFTNAGYALAFVDRVLGLSQLPSS